MVNVVSRVSVAALMVAAGLSQTAIAAPITSNWTPGTTGNWSGGAPADAVNWTHSSVPATTTFPNNAGGDNFTVNIDNGGVGNSTVNLNADVTIDQLNVSSGDTLNLNNGSDLTFDSGTTLTNNGNINLNSLGGANQIKFFRRIQHQRFRHDHAWQSLQQPHYPARRRFGDHPRRDPHNPRFR